MIDIEDNAVRLNEFDQNEWRDWILKWNPGERRNSSIWFGMRCGTQGEEEGALTWGP